MEKSFPLPQTKQDHVRALETFLGFLEPLEQQLTDRLESSHPLLTERGKTEWLKEDLRAIGHSEAEIARLPRCLNLPAIESVARALGVLYVLEGATLGGQIISRHLETHLGFANGAGYRYFRSYGSQVGQRWQEFRALAVRFSSPADDDHSIAAAIETFVRLGEWSRRTA